MKLHLTLAALAFLPGMVFAQDASGKAHEMCLAISKAIGTTKMGVLERTVETNPQPSPHSFQPHWRRTRTLKASAMEFGFSKRTFGESVRTAGKPDSFWRTDSDRCTRKFAAVTKRTKSIPTARQKGCNPTVRPPRS